LAERVDRGTRLRLGEIERRLPVSSAAGCSARPSSPPERTRQAAGRAGPVHETYVFYAALNARKAAFARKRMRLDRAPSRIYVASRERACVIRARGSAHARRGSASAAPRDERRLQVRPTHGRSRACSRGNAVVGPDRPDFRRRGWARVAEEERLQDESAGVAQSTLKRRGRSSAAGRCGPPQPRRRARASP